VSAIFRITPGSLAVVAGHVEAVEAVQIGGALSLPSIHSGGKAISSQRRIDATE